MTKKIYYTLESLSTSSKCNAMGGMLILIAAVAFAFKGIFVKLAFEESVSIIALLFLRFLMSTPLFWLSSLILQRPNNFSLTVQHLKGCFLTGFLFFISTVTDFTAISLIDVSIERVILFTYPAFILMFSAVLTRKFPAKVHIIAFVITYVGIGMIVGITSKWFIFFKNIKGTIWALAAACSYALYLMKSQDIIKDMGAIKFTVISNSITFFFLSIYFLFFGNFQQLHISLKGLFYIIIISIFCTVIPFFILFEGINRIGAMQSGLISMIGPAITLLAAYLLLGENLDANQMLGAFITIFGIFIIKGSDIIQNLWKYLSRRD